MKRIIFAGFLGCMMMGVSFANSFTQYDLAELLVNKAIAKDIIENKAYTEEEILSFVIEHNLFEITDSKSKVAQTTVSTALANFENIEIKTEKNKPEEIISKDVVETMLENVLASTKLSPITVEEIQKLADKGIVYCTGGTYMENGKMVVVDSTNMESALTDIVEIACALQPHAEKNSQMVSISGGGTGMAVDYGENREQLRRDQFMFSIAFYRNVEWANQEEVNDKLYTFDKEVTVDFLFDGVRLEDEVIDHRERIAYRDEHIDMEEDVLNALYDGLRALDGSRSEKLFEKMTTDYIYSKTNTYGDPNNSFKELFEIDGQLILREDVRAVTGSHRYITYKFVK